MKAIHEPFYTVFDRDNNVLTKYSSYEERKISDMMGCFEHEDIREKMIAEGDPVVYKVYKQEVPLIEGELLHCITIIEPGTVSGEFFMTKGHYHINESCAEIYYGQKGHGLLLLQKGHEFKTIAIEPDTAAYIPAGWGHRTINVSEEEPFVFFSVWPGQSGYNYQRSMDEPFTRRVFSKDGSYCIL